MRCEEDERVCIWPVGAAAEQVPRHERITLVFGADAPDGAVVFATAPDAEKLSKHVAKGRPVLLQVDDAEHFEPLHLRGGLDGVVWRGSCPEEFLFAAYGAREFARRRRAAMGSEWQQGTFDRVVASISAVLDVTSAWLCTQPPTTADLESLRRWREHYQKITADSKVAAIQLRNLKNEIVTLVGPLTACDLHEELSVLVPQLKRELAINMSFDVERSSPSAPIAFPRGRLVSLIRRITLALCESQEGLKSVRVCAQRVRGLIRLTLSYDCIAPSATTDDADAVLGSFREDGAHLHFCPELLAAGAALYLREESGGGTVVIDFSAHDASAAPRRGREGAGTLNALVVEDDVHVLNALATLLRRGGAKVETAVTIDHALSLARASQTSFDLLISDYRLPDGTAVSLLSELRLLNPEMVAVVCSGYKLSEEEHLSLGDAGFMEKPFGKGDLERHLRLRNIVLRLPEEKS